MKALKFQAFLLVVAITATLASCNSGDDKKADDKAADTTAAKTEIPPPPPSASPLGNVMTITHKVSSFAKWKPEYDAHDSIRQSVGLHNYVVARGVEDTNIIFVAMKMDDINKAKGWAASPELKERMKKAGVIGPVTTAYDTTIMSDTSTNAVKVRLRITQKVKDWDAWKKVFDSDKPARVDAGLTDRVVGHAIGDDHDIVVVFAVSDLSKAKAFIASKALKDKMTEAGATGAPTFFFYTIAEKY